VTERYVYTVYVIELDDEVYGNAPFRAANPDWNPAKPCVYVGSTALTPEERFGQHLAGYKSNMYAHKYGKRLMPRLYRSWQDYPTRAGAITSSGDGPHVRRLRRPDRTAAR
jgi:hypothetical protein